MKRWDNTLKFERRQMRQYRFWFWWAAFFAAWSATFAAFTTGWFLAGFLACFVVDTVMCIHSWHMWHACRLRVRIMVRVMEAIARQPSD